MTSSDEARNDRAVEKHDERREQICATCHGSGSVQCDICGDLHCCADCDGEGVTR